jgi:adenylate cyclase
MGEALDLDLVVNLTRGLGQTMARLSDWEIAALVHHAETRRDVAEEDTGSTDGTSGALAAATGVMVDFNATFEELMLYVWRRHMNAAVARLEAAASGELGTTQLSVGFADIVQFTALSNTLTEQKIGDLVELFESRCADVVAVNHGRIIKSLGDSVLFVNDDPIRAYDTAEGIINVIGRDPRMPDVRVGLATGSVVARLGDVYGPPVNMAARLTAVARKNRIIIDETTAALLPDDQFETRRLPARPVRGFGIVEPVAVRRN